MRLGDGFLAVFFVVAAFSMGVPPPSATDFRREVAQGWATVRVRRVTRRREPPASNDRLTQTQKSLVQHKGTAEDDPLWVARAKPCCPFFLLRFSLGKQRKMKTQAAVEEKANTKPQNKQKKEAAKL